MVVTRSSPAGETACPASLRAKARDVVLHALGERGHLLAGGGQRVAGAVALEELDAEALLDLPEAAENRRMVDAEALRGAGKAPAPRRSILTSLKSSQAMRHGHPSCTRAKERRNL